MTIENLSANKVFGGWHKQYSHVSSSLNCKMQFSIYLPPQASVKNNVPVLYWLSGLTCTEENFMQKSNALRIASKLGMAIVVSDTSPRGDKVPDDPEKKYDLGLGAGFYVNATQAPWNVHYQMYDYILHELPSLIESNFPVSLQRAISGHSMGGHGALVIGIRNAESYASISAFSPICNPMNCAWGIKAFTAYLGEDKTNWQQYDASELIKHSNKHIPTLVTQGGSDEFLEQQLKTDVLERAANNSSYSIDLKIEKGYDHSYYFISSFIEEHLYFHAKHLQLIPNEEQKR